MAIILFFISLLFISSLSLSLSSLLLFEIKFYIENDIEAELSAHRLIIEWKCKWVMTRDPADT